MGRRAESADSGQDRRCAGIGCGVLAPDSTPFCEAAPMKLKILCVGRAKERFVQEGIAKYLRFLGHYADIEIRDIKDEKVTDLKDAPLIRRREQERINRAIPTGAFVIALDERGQELTSHEFASLLVSLKDNGVREIVFVIGGALGLDEAVTKRADKTLAISRLTLTHEMTRLVLLEQLYRAFTIITGKTYHY